MNNAIKALGVIIVLAFGTWLGYATNSLQQGIVGGIVLLNCMLLIDLSYMTNKGRVN
jgi:hypothetical protein